LLKRNSFPEDDSPNKESDPVPNNKTEEEAIPQDLLENFNLTILKKGYSEIFIKLQEVKQEYEEKIKQIVAKAAELQEQNSKFLEKLQDDKQNFGEKLKELKIKAQQKLDKLKIEGKQKLQELKDKAQSQQENRTTKRDSTVSLNEGGVISILLGGPTALVSAFKQKVSEIENVAKELLEKFISSFDGNSDILDNLRSMVSDFVKANLSESEVASATFSCFEAQEDAISNLVNLTGE
jgi:DNA repair exonuclease SbcCD ATPase subunit